MEVSTEERFLGWVGLVVEAVGGGGGCVVVGGALARRGVGGFGRVVPLVEVGVCLEEETSSFHLRYEASTMA